MEEYYKELLIALKEIKDAVTEDLGRVAICVPAIKAFELALHHEPWIAWELAVQFHLGRKKYEHAMYALYNEGELGIDAVSDNMAMIVHHMNVRNREEQIGYVCANCYKRMEYDEPSCGLYCSVGCLFDREIGAITVPSELAPPYQFTNEPACIYLMKASEFGY